MKLQWSCSQGHHWPLARGNSRQPVGVKPVCPVCGGPGVTLGSPPATAAAEEQATVRFNSNDTDPGSISPQNGAHVEFTSTPREERSDPRGSSPDEAQLPKTEPVSKASQYAMEPIPDPSHQAPTIKEPSQAEVDLGSQPNVDLPTTKILKSDLLFVPVKTELQSEVTQALPPGAFAEKPSNPTVQPPAGATRPDRNVPAFVPTPKTDLDQRTLDFDGKVRPGNSLVDRTLPLSGSKAGDKKDQLELIQVAGYEILGVLGRGGMGVVYKARHRKLNRMTALKMVLSGRHSSAEDLMRFQIEAEAVAKLQHPNIVQIYEVGEQDGHPYFSLEFVEGGTLQGKTEGKPLPARDAAKILEQLARAMHYAHQRNVLHRDLKPANVLLTADGTPKITDFGLAKKMGDDSSQTGTGHIMGTPSYMAPEQAQGKTQELGPASDIYSLGAVLYELLTGRPPFSGATVLHTLQQVQNDDPVPPGRLNSEVPADLETICLKCLQKEPRKRYETAEAFAEDLQRFLKQEPIKARPIGVVERAWKWAKRRPAVAGLLALLAAVLTGGFFGMFGLWQRAEKERALAEKAQEGAVRESQAARVAEKAAQEAKAVAEKREEEAKVANKKAEKSLDTSLRTLYAANMNLAREAWQHAQVHRLKELLESAASKSESKNLEGFEFNYLWNLFRSERLALKSHTQIIRTVAFRPPEGNQLASASVDGTIVLWDPQAPPGEKYRFLKAHTGPVRTLSFSKDGRWLASGGEDGVVCIWDIASGKTAEPFRMAGKGAWVNALAFSGDAVHLAAGFEDGSIKLWNWQNAKELFLLKKHDYAIADLAFHPTRGQLASAGMDNRIVLWDLDFNAKKAEPLSAEMKHDQWITSLAYSPDGKRLASGGWGDKVRLWDPDTGEATFYLEGLKSPLRTLSFSPDNHRLAAACQDQSVLVWDVNSKKVLRTFPPGHGIVRSVAFSADGQLLASVNFDLVALQTMYRTAPRALMAGLFGPDRDHLAAASIDGKVYFWNLATDDEPAASTEHQAPIRALAFSPDRKEYASAGEDGQVYFHEQDGRFKKSRPMHDKWILALAYSPKGDKIATGSADKKVGVYSFANDLTHYFVAHDGHVQAAAFSPDGSWLATGGADRKIKLWDIANGFALVFEAEHNGPVTSVAFSKLGLLASAGWDGVVTLWEPKTRTKIQDLKGHTHGITGIAFSPDGKRLASGSEDRSVKIWDVITGQETLTLKGHDQGITSIAFSRDGTRLISTSWDQSVLIWDAGAAKK